MTITLRTALIPIAIGLAAASTSAEAQTSGSAQRSTYRSCAALAASEQCIGDDADPRQVIVQDVYAGGIGNFDPAILELDRPGTTNDAYARSYVNLGNLSLPGVRGETRAGEQDRMNINAFGFQTFTWTGDQATPFALTATMHIVDSSTSTPLSPGLPNAAVGTAYVGVWTPDVLAGLTTGKDIFSALFNAPCGAPGVLGRGFISSRLPGGEFSRSVSTAECNPGSLTLTPGQQVLTVVSLQLPVNRGGWADATHSLTTDLDPTLPENVRAQLVQYLVPDIPAVPEPKTWSMMLAGFAAIGAALRRRPRRFAAA